MSQLSVNLLISIGSKIWIATSIIYYNLFSCKHFGKYFRIVGWLFEKVQSYKYSYSQTCKILAGYSWNTANTDYIILYCHILYILDQVVICMNYREIGFQSKSSVGRRTQVWFRIQKAPQLWASGRGEAETMIEGQVTPWIF